MYTRTLLVPFIGDIWSLGGGSRESSPKPQEPQDPRKEQHQNISGTLHSKPSRIPASHSYRLLPEGPKHPRVYTCKTIKNVNPTHLLPKVFEPLGMETRNKSCLGVFIIRIQVRHNSLRVRMKVSVVPTTTSRWTNLTSSSCFGHEGPCNPKP